MRSTPYTYYGDEIGKTNIDMLPEVGAVRETLIDTYGNTDIRANVATLRPYQAVIFQLLSGGALVIRRLRREKRSKILLSRPCFIRQKFLLFVPIVLATLPVRLAYQGESSFL